MTDNSKIILKDIKKSFGEKKVLGGIDLEVNEGESLVVIGGSGSGKSVLLKCILGLMEPDDGTINIGGEDTTHLRSSERAQLMHKFGMLFQGGALFDSLTVWENITFALVQREQINRDECRDLAIKKLQSVGLGAEVATMFPAELSGGMQKRVALARAICTNPEIIFFDEPTTGLDPIMADVINELIIDCSKDLGATTVTITHDMASATKIATNIAMLYQGRIIWHGRAQDVYHSKNDYVDQFVHGRAHGPIEIKLQDH